MSTLKTSSHGPRPQAFRLDDPNVHFGPQASGSDVHIEPQADAFIAEPAADEQAIELAQQNLLTRVGVWSWAGLFWSATGALISLALGLWVTQIIDGLFARAAALGWGGLALAGLALLAMLALVLREILAIHRQKNVARLHIALAKASAQDDAKAARQLMPSLIALYAKRPEMAAARAKVQSLSGEIIDGTDLIGIFEQNLMKNLDAQVQTEIAAAAKRVSVFTALAPRALLDVIFVAAQIIRLIRRIAEIYGGKPGLFGFFRLAKTVGTHLVITGGVAVGDSLLQQVVGHGIAAKLSAKLGEGVLNGILTARVGLSAMAVCRPMPFLQNPAPGLKQVVPSLFSKQS